MSQQHAGLTAERWMAFTVDQQIAMIANEMSRAGHLSSADDNERRRNSYERTLRLADLTIEVNARRGLRYELLRFRDVVAELYLAREHAPATHAAAQRCLVLLTPGLARMLAPRAPTS